MSDRPLLLDLFCGAGGAAMGYYRAGFDVVGVDIKPMPRYPFEFHQADALEYCAAHGREFDVIHASPVCKRYSVLAYRYQGKEYPDQVVLVRDELEYTGKPYIIENVVGAPLNNPLLLCGSMFGLKVIRHRLFECKPPVWFLPGPCQHKRGVVGRRGHLGLTDWMTVTGHFSNIEKAKKAMDINWMTQTELSQSIPPAYTEFIGKQLLQHLNYDVTPRIMV